MVYIGAYYFEFLRVNLHGKRVYCSLGKTDLEKCGNVCYQSQKRRKDAPEKRHCFDSSIKSSALPAMFLESILKLKQGDLDLNNHKTIPELYHQVKVTK